MLGKKDVSPEMKRPEPEFVMKELIDGEGRAAASASVDENIVSGIPVDPLLVLKRRDFPGNLFHWFGKAEKDPFCVFCGFFRRNDRKVGSGGQLQDFLHIGGRIPFFPGRRGRKNDPVLGFAVFHERNLGRCREGHGQREHHCWKMFHGQVPFVVACTSGFLCMSS
ncbi:MAG: hypothetical protein BWY31_04511 [Lentisphaerae bacterium ADurb.Bin242]|nr:MAG: hypothetical protein BWY31_04511 [Lentisphaerae bacterium ADurb.Bin242]